MRTLLLLAGLFFQVQAMAWGFDGHRTIGQVAWNYLEEGERRQVERLLVTIDETSLADGATWADRIRSLDQYDWAAPLHYINLPADWNTYRATVDCPEEGCVMQAIQHFQRQLANRALADRERAEALLFLSHFIGDLHQPLHTGLREDRGGNDREVYFFGFPSNLHAVWDTHLPAGVIRGDWLRYSLIAVAKTSEQDFVEWSNSGVEDWLKESQRFAHSNAYTDAVHLGEDYYAVNAPLVELRLRQAGVRLAIAIRAALSDG